MLIYQPLYPFILWSVHIIVFLYIFWVLSVFSGFIVVILFALTQLRVVVPCIFDILIHLIALSMQSCVLIGPIKINSILIHTYACCHQLYGDYSLGSSKNKIRQISRTFRNILAVPNFVYRKHSWNLELTCFHLWWFCNSSVSSS